MTILNYESSPISWCEQNYEMILYICEFYNTLTGLAYVLSGLFFKSNLTKIFGDKFYITNYNNKIFVKILFIHILHIYLLNFYNIFSNTIINGSTFG